MRYKKWVTTYLVGWAEQWHETIKFHRTENRDIFQGAYKLFCVILTIQSTSASVELSFSGLKSIKTYLQNTKEEDKLTNLSKKCFKKLLNELISTQPLNHEDIIDKVSNLKARRIHHIQKCNM